MNLRQAQRSLAELMSKCEAAHIELPEDPLEARAEAVEAIIHSLKNDKINLDDAQDELLQKFGFELAWQQHLRNEEAKLQRRRQSYQKRVSNRAKSNTSLSQASKSLGFLPEAPPEDEGLETQDSSLVQGSNASGTQYRKSKSTPLKRLAADQKVSTRTKVAKKAKIERGLVLPETSSETEEKPAPGLQGKDTHDDSASSDAADQDIAALLELEGLDDADGVNDESSDEFTL